MAVTVSVFFSYSHADKAVARKLASYLNDQGFRVWIDEGELAIGDSIIERGNWIGSALLFFFPLERGSVGVYLRVRLGRGVVRLCPMRPSFVMMRPGCVLRTRG
jgi:hypothetical protein